MSGNPFYQERFVERELERELYPMVDASPPHNVAIVGGFGFGKTLIFNRLCSRLKELRQKNVLLCAVRLARRPDALDRQGFYAFLHRCLREAARPVCKEVADAAELDPKGADVLLEDIFRICSVLCRSKVSVVFAFDGFERIASCFGSREQRDLGPLRALSDDSGVSVRFLIAARAHPMHIEQSASMNSKFFTLFTATERVLHPFTSAETECYLRRPGAEDIPRGVVEYLHSQSGGMLKVLGPMAIWVGRLRHEMGAWPSIGELERLAAHGSVPEIRNVYLQLTEDLKAYGEVGYSEAMCRVALGAPIHGRSEELRACLDLGYFSVLGDGAFRPVCPIFGDVLRDYARTRLQEVWPVIGKLEVSLRRAVRILLGRSEGLDWKSALKKRNRTLFRRLSEEAEKDRVRRPVACADYDLLDYSYLDDLRDVMLASSGEFPALFPDSGAKARLNDLLKVVIDVRNPKAHFREVDAMSGQAAREAATKLLGLLAEKGEACL